MKSLRTLGIAIACSTILFGCGGGGGGGSTTAPAPVASTAMFQILPEIANDFNSVGTKPFSITGTRAGVPVTGNGTVTSGSISATVFEGVTALKKSQTVSATITVSGTSIPISSTTTVYVDSSYKPLGSVDSSEYSVLVGALTIPSTAKVYDTGTAYTMNRYSDSSKVTRVGSKAVTYTIMPDTADTALLVVVNTYRDTLGNMTQQDTSTTRITPTGGFTNLTEVGVVFSSALTLTFTY